MDIGKQAFFQISAKLIFALVNHVKVTTSISNISVGSKVVRSDVLFTNNSCFRAPFYAFFISFVIFNICFGTPIIHFFN